MTRGSLDRRVSALERRLHSNDETVPDDADEALERGLLRPKHLKALYAEESDELKFWITSFAWEARARRELKKSPFEYCFAPYFDEIEMVSYPVDETPTPSTLEHLTRLPDRFPLAEMQLRRNPFPTDPVISALRSHFALLLLETPDALALRAEVHTDEYLEFVLQRRKDKEEEDREAKRGKVQVALTPDLAFGPKIRTVRTCLCPWLEIKRKRDVGWQ